MTSKFSDETILDYDGWTAKQRCALRRALYVRDRLAEVGVEIRAGDPHIAIAPGQAPAPVEFHGTEDLDEEGRKLVATVQWLARREVDLAVALYVVASPPEERARRIQLMADRTVAEWRPPAEA